MDVARLLLTPLLALGALSHALPQEEAPDSLRVPAFTAYFQPDPDRGAKREQDGRLSAWEATTRLQWFGRCQAAGELSLSLELAEAAPADARLRLSVFAQGSEQPQDQFEFRIRKASKELLVPIARCTIEQPGYLRFALEAAQAGAPPSLKALVLAGPASLGAHFSDVERRNASSVHLGYALPQAHKDEIEWFYMELTPRSEPLYSYYMATGFSRGYFGMQVNSPSERRLIFSVWDAGNEGVDRNKVAEQDRVVLLNKGADVFAGSFGNEGTGGHSHLKYDWKLGDTFRFLLRAEPAAAPQTTTTYSAWFFFPEANDWGLIASFRAPRDGKFLRGLYSFNENFAGSNGDQLRLCEFGNAWVRSKSGVWSALEDATFTHDGHGKQQRLDRSAGVINGRFYLSNGGFVDDQRPGAVSKAYDKLRCENSSGAHPTDAQLQRLVEDLARTALANKPSAR
jgi:hypothetical protein